MYTLYTIPGSCSTGISILMEKLGVAYTPINRDDVQNYQDIVPTNQVPALKLEDGTVITEGAAIAQFLIERHQPALMGANEQERIAFLQWLNFEYATLHPAYGRLFATLKNPNLQDEIKSDLLQYLADKLSATWDIIEARLENQKYMLKGDEPSFLDYMLTIYTSWEHYFPTTKIALGKNIKRLTDEIQALPEFKKAYAAERVEFKAAA